MAKPEKRWQLLLVADDGRIIPFKRIKGIAVSLTILLVLLGLVCAALTWQLTAEKTRHQQTLDQVADANRQVGHYKSEYELITAELVLAQARMEKAGLLIPKPPAMISQQKAETTVAADALSDTKIDDGKKETEPTVSQPVAKQPPTQPATIPVAGKPAPKATPAAGAADPKQPAVALGDLQMKHDREKKILLAGFRVKNTGPRSSPVAGRCVVVLKNNTMGPATWQAMPDVPLMSGKPDGERGQPFKISRFMDMKIETTVQADPSSLKTATVYVFDTSGSKILEKDFSIALPAPKPKPAALSRPAAPPPAKTSVNQQTQIKGTGGATGNLPMTNPADDEAGTVPQPVPTHAPADDPSLTDSGQPVQKEDARDRF